ncbi:MAG: hydrogen peroxide-inducible genes activator [Nitrospina sp.]|nr:hydrogen peroxide-inducible genes activator [Nitrospina sp.]MBT3875630.1 hydrogen peroxide-inducible genes activator [Nitrospina sp.]MBT4047534.1 hydrogen peroxide-inducible genes activator [Nitrospina sp.]MBT4558109.1 hydrogen peroxide-inducible genes activator [Nitrospina sp.]MBT5348612.1 hydrogen peroxide-inducible genes activator [Nitrospina sp.]
MSLTQLTYVLAVAQSRNFVKAARSCFISQPTLSMQIHKLEEELGVTLFDRSRKPVEPTAIGKKIIEQAQTVLQEACRIEEIIKLEKGEISGDFKLGIIPTLAPYLLPLFLESFTKSYPRVNLIVEELQTQQIIRLLRLDKIDAGVLVTPLNSNGIVERPLFNDPFVVYLAPNHPLHRLKKVSGSDLILDDIWLLNEGHCFRDQAIEICKRVKGLPKKNLEFESGNLETLKRLVDKNFGYTLVPSLAILEMSKTDLKKKVRFFKSPAPTREVSIVYSRSYLKKSIIEALHKKIVSSLPKEYRQPLSETRVVKLPSFR